MASSTLQPFYTFRDSILGLIHADPELRKQYVHERIFGDIDVAIQDIIPPSQMPDVKLRKKTQYQKSLFRYILATYEPDLGDMVKMRNSGEIKGNPAIYLKNKYGEEIIEYIGGKSYQEFVDYKDVFGLWQKVERSINKYNLNLITAATTYIFSPESYPLNQTDIDMFLSQNNVPNDITNLPIENQLSLRRLFPFAWLNKDLPSEWVGENNKNVRYAEEMHGGKKNLINGSSTQGLNTSLKNLWKRPGPSHPKQYQQFMFALDHNPVTLKPLILFRGISMKTPRIGDEIVEHGFSSKSYLYDIASKYGGDTCCTLIISYPANHKFVMVNDQSKAYLLEIVSYPGEVLRVTNTLGNDIYCEFVRYQTHIDPEGVEIVVPRQTEYSIIDTSMLYAYEEITIYYRMHNNDIYEDYDKIYNFLETTDSVTTPIKIEGVDSDIVDDLDQYFQTGRLPVLDSLREGHPEIARAVRYFTRNIVTTTPSEAFNFHEYYGFTSLQDVINDSETSQKIKTVIYWRSHLTQAIPESDINDMINVMTQLGINVTPNTIPYWRQNYPVISVSTSDNAAALIKLQPIIKATLDTNLVIIQTHPNTLARLVQLE